MAPVVNLRAEWRAPALLALALFVLYAATAPRTVVLEDDGLFLMAAHANGIAHPPGYPLYTLLAHAATLVPVGSVAWRVHALSGLFAALACAALWLAGRRLGLARVPALLAAAALGVSPAFWSQAIVAEVYTLNALLVFLLLGLALRWRGAAGDAVAPRGVATAGGVLFGLGLANHWPLLLLVTPALLLVLAPVTHQVLRSSHRVLAGVAIGLLPYAWMVARSHQLPDIAYYGPIESLADLWRILSRADYAESDRSPTAGAGDRLGLGGFLLAELARQFGPAGAAFLAVGLLARWRGWGQRRDTLEPALLLGFLGPTAGLILLLAFDDDPFRRTLLHVYPLAAYGFAALWLGAGAQLALAWLPGRAPTLQRALPVLLAALTLLPPLVSTPNVRTGDDWARRYGEAVLAAVPPGSILLADGEWVAGPVGYLNRVERVRPDVTVTSSGGIVFGNRIFRAERLAPAQRLDAARAWLKHQQRPVFYAWPFDHGLGRREYGLLRQVDAGAAGTRLEVSPVLMQYAHDMLRAPVPADPWSRFHRAQLTQELAAYLVWIDRSSRSPVLLRWRDAALALTRRSLHGCLAEGEALLARDGAGAVPRVLPLLDAAQQRRHEWIYKRDLAALETLGADVARLSGDGDAAAAGYRRALALWPHEDNEARGRLAALGGPELP